uniref:Leucine-rich repeat-containing N-terminal plant-type domain-containing protein n=1 Tax=Salix viminalis TaxID=40686 RepID=A0A6N2M5I1_SALVM
MVQGMTHAQAMARLQYPHPESQWCQVELKKVYFTGIDFSCNNFTREIPPNIGNLSKIKVLNLLHNGLIGPIPPTFSSVAHNNLFGKTLTIIAQSATFEESSYKDNSFLCGQPLIKACDADMPSSPMPISTNNNDNGGFMGMEVFYVIFGVAYIMVLLVIGAVLYINPYWERAWFHFIECSFRWRGCLERSRCSYLLVIELLVVDLVEED